MVETMVDLELLVTICPRAWKNLLVHMKMAGALRTIRWRVSTWKPYYEQSEKNIQSASVKSHSFFLSLHTSMSSNSFNISNKTGEGLITSTDFCKSKTEMFGCARTVLLTSRQHWMSLNSLKIFWWSWEMLLKILLTMWLRFVSILPRVYLDDRRVCAIMIIEEIV